MTAHLPDQEEQHFIACMDVWASWMHQKDSHKLGVPSRDSTCGQSLTNYRVAEDDADVIYDHLDKRVAEIVDEKCVRGLLPSQRQAVFMHYGLSRVWPFNDLDRFLELRLGMAYLRQKVRQWC